MLVTIVVNCQGSGFYYCTEVLCALFTYCVEIASFFSNTFSIVVI